MPSKVGPRPVLDNTVQTETEKPASTVSPRKAFLKKHLQNISSFIKKFEHHPKVPAEPNRYGDVPKAARQQARDAGDRQKLDELQHQNRQGLYNAIADMGL